MSVSLSVYLGPSIDVIVTKTEQNEDRCKDHNRKDSDKYCPKCGLSKSQRCTKYCELSLNADVLYIDSKGKEQEILASFNDVSRWSDIRGIKTSDGQTKVVLIPGDNDKFSLIKDEVNNKDYYAKDIDFQKMQDNQAKFEEFYATELAFLRGKYTINIVNRFISWIC